MLTLNIGFFGYQIQNQGFLSISSKISVKKRVSSIWRDPF
jgi:hypothetical protein